MAIIELINHSQTKRIIKNGKEFIVIECHAEPANM